VAGVQTCQNLPKERYALSDDTTIIPLHQPGSIIDPLTEIAREGARRMLMAALKAEAASFVALFGDELLPDGRQRVVRHGAGPERTIQTGIGPITVQRQKVRDRATAVPPEAKIRFSSNILPRWARRSKSLDALLPVLYLRGISTGDFQEALAALLGEDAPNLSPGVIARLTAGWKDDYDRWRRRDLSTRRYVYIWADGVYLQARMEPEAECILVIIGATPEGKKELLGFHVGVRESARDAGASCWSTSSPVAWPFPLNWPSGMVLWASGRRSRRSFPAHATSGAGSTRLRRCSITSLKPCSRACVPICGMSITLKPGPPRWPPSNSSSRNTASNTPAR
jgi:Transposase, Mutator family